MKDTKETPQELLKRIDGCLESITNRGEQPTDINWKFWRNAIKEVLNESE